METNVSEVVAFTGLYTAPQAAALVVELLTGVTSQRHQALVYKYSKTHNVSQLASLANLEFISSEAINWARTQPKFSKLRAVASKIITTEETNLIVVNKAHMDSELRAAITGADNVMSEAVVQQLYEYMLDVGLLTNRPIGYFEATAIWADAEIDGGFSYHNGFGESPEELEMLVRTIGLTTTIINEVILSETGELPAAGEWLAFHKDGGAVIMSKISSLSDRRFASTATPSRLRNTNTSVSARGLEWP